jgi:hypothetical protein
MMAFAESWIAAWNRRDVEAVLAHYSKDAQFVSPVATTWSVVLNFATKRSLRTTGVLPSRVSRR